MRSYQPKKSVPNKKVMAKVALSDWSTEFDYGNNKKVAAKVALSDWSTEFDYGNTKNWV